MRLDSLGLGVVGTWTLAVAVACLGLAAWVDGPVALWLRESGVASQVDRGWWSDQLKAMGSANTAALAALLSARWHRWGWRAGAMVVLAGSIASIAEVAKWVTGRVRPFKGYGPVGVAQPMEAYPLSDGLWGLLHTPNLCFPSGHAALASAVAISMAFLYPRGRWVWFAVATAVAAERVMENAHWVSDVVAGAALGFAAASAAAHILRPRPAARAAAEWAGDGYADAEPLTRP